MNRFTVTDCGAVLLFGVGSAVLLDTAPVMLLAPAVVARTLTCTVALAPLAMLPRLHVACPVPVFAEQLPTLEVAETSANPAGIVVWNCVATAVFGPPFVIVKV